MSKPKDLQVTTHQQQGESEEFFPKTLNSVESPSERNKDVPDFNYPVHDFGPKPISHFVPAPPIMKRQIGKLYVFIDKKPGPDGVSEPLCVGGPCWPMFFVTFTLILGSCGLLYGFFLHTLPVILTVLWWIGVGMVLISLTATSCSNPGIRRRYQAPKGVDWTYSQYADSYRPVGAKYELESQVLLDDIDHFCAWTGTVIAKRNLFYFKVFVRSCSILCLWTIIMVVLYAVEYADT